MFPDLKILPQALPLSKFRKRFLTRLQDRRQRQSGGGEFHPIGIPRVEKSDHSLVRGCHGPVQTPAVVEEVGHIRHARQSWRVRQRSAEPAPQDVMRNGVTARRHPDANPPVHHAQVRHRDKHDNQAQSGSLRRIDAVLDLSTRERRLPHHRLTGRDQPPNARLRFVRPATRRQRRQRRLPTTGRRHRGSDTRPTHSRPRRTDHRP